MNTVELLDATTRNLLTFPADTRVAVSSITGMGDFPVWLGAPAAEDRGSMTLGELAAAMRAFDEAGAGPWYRRAWYVADDEMGTHWRAELPV
jgi:hypothetical protein